MMTTLDHIAVAPGVVPRAAARRTGAAPNRVFYRSRPRSLVARAHRVLLCVAQELADRFGQALPPGLLFGEPLLARPGQPVRPRAPVVLGHHPFGADPA